MIDYMVMPLCRYLTHDYITPSMQEAWDAGCEYRVFMPDGERVYPPGVPWGGLDASHRRSQKVGEVETALRSLPKPLSDQLWDERSKAKPTIRRVKTKSHRALVGEAPKIEVNGSWLGLIQRKRQVDSHLKVRVFLPCDFEAPLEIGAPFKNKQVVGSAVRGLAELDRVEWSGVAKDAARVLKEALDDCVRLKLPMIVDE
jgi:hypothetical protein